MKVRDPRIRSLLRQAERTAGAGKRAAAQQLYRQITEEAPEVVDGWLGLAQTTRDSERREAAYKRVLELEPENATALQALDGQVNAPLATTPAAALEAPAETAEGGEEESVEESEQDPFDQSRAWLQEATRRQKPPGVPQERATPRAAPEGQSPQPETAEVEAPVDALPPLDLTLPASEEVTDEPLFCYRHPDRQTGLRCYSCDRPICIKCAKRTPVGYRCPQCIRETEGVFYTANVLDYLLAGTVTLLLGVLAGFIVNFIGFFVIFIGPAAGSIIGRIGFRAARRHHGRWLPHLVAGMVAAGGLLPTILPLIPALLTGRFSLAGLGFGLLWPLVYVFLATGAAFYQVK